MTLSVMREYVRTRGWDVAVGLITGLRLWPGLGFRTGSGFCGYPIHRFGGFGLDMDI